MKNRIVQVGWWEFTHDAPIPRDRWRLGAVHTTEKPCREEQTTPQHTLRVRLPVTAVGAPVGCEVCTDTRAVRESALLGVCTTEQHKLQLRKTAGCLKRSR